MNSFWNNDRTLSQTDPEFIEFFSNFAYDEVVNEPGANHPDLDDKTRSLAILAVLVGCQGLDAFEMMLPVAYETGLSSIAIKEMVYQATAYCGFGKTLPFLKKLNNFLGAANVHLPLEPQGTITPETRAKAGEVKQIETYRMMQEMVHKAADEYRQEMGQKKVIVAKSIISDVDKKDIADTLEYYEEGKKEIEDQGFDL